ncbi:hypothetical protein IQ276_009410 [Desmonostoc muscorum LEGE 12446]|uniref:Uncharacterized protein n=1 Tax=Desmonostoc muscorum LEGE 12446 TaxID=1828758 RepID=A0A8J6ZK56_DESMC|nr:hypothetical protein [Desmonostoc muscorum]MCF2146664.1 hypothetical protein [Desmonostoc muscorum LEGE 12446]
MLSNLDLIREFIQNSIHKKDILLSNPSLTAQTVYKTNQLTAKSEGLIAIAQISNTPCQFSISPNSSHWELINQALAEYSYILKGEIDSRGFYQYQYCEIPKGYEMQCTKSVLLWRAWWKYRKYTLRPGIPLELLIRTRDSWYPIRDLIISDGLLYIKTLGSEIALDSNDLVTWLKKIEVS